MTEHPLFTGTGVTTLFRSHLDVPPLPPGDCLRDAAQLRDWIGRIVVQVASRERALFAYTAGPASAATPDDRDKPRILFDEEGRFLGLSLWVPEIQNWSLAGVPGELKTVANSSGSLEEDMARKALHGWFLADGSHAGLPDLTAEAARFAGTAPDWDLYTVGKVG